MKCRNLLQAALAKGPNFKLPQREMLVYDFMEWVRDLHEENGSLMRGWRPTHGCVSGKDYGAVVFLEPESDDGIVVKMLLENRLEVNIGARHEYRFDKLGSAWEVLDNHSVDTAKIFRAADECTFRVSKHWSAAIAEAGPWELNVRENANQCDSLCAYPNAEC